MTLGLRVRLSIMMFLQYFVWGIWLPFLAVHLGPESLKFDPIYIGWIYTVYGFGAIIGPFVVGQLADRYFATEKIMFVCHFLGGLLLIASAYVTTFWPLFLLLFLYCNLYMPTMGLSNSITFRNLGEGNQDQFPGIRLWGTIGWIISGLMFAAYLDYNNLGFWKMFADLLGLTGPFSSFLGWWREAIVPSLVQLHSISFIGEPQKRDCLRAAGLVSVIFSFYCLLLPHTPPVPADVNAPVDKKSAVLESLELMRSPSFAVLVIVTGLVGIMLAFYFALETVFLVHIGIDSNNTAAFMTIGQIAELVIMAFVPLAVSKLGVKKTMIVGASAWALRFALSAYGHPQWLMILSIVLHGFAFGFFFVVAQMYVDNAASKDIKATAQNLLVFVVYGLGTIFGSIITGVVRKANTDAAGVENWTGIWLGPCILTLICIVIFAVGFRESSISKKSVSLDSLDA